MPLFFAPVRKNNKPQSSGGPDEYTRAQPSLFRYIAASKDLVGSTLFAISFFTALAISLFAVFNGNKGYAPPVHKVTSVWIDAGEEMLPFRYPSVALAFKQNFIMTREIQLLLDAHGASEPQRIIVGKKTKNVYFLHSITDSSVSRILALQPYLDTSYRATMGYVSPRSLQHYKNLVNVVSVVSSTFFHTFKTYTANPQTKARIFWKSTGVMKDVMAHTELLDSPFDDNVTEGSLVKMANDYDAGVTAEAFVKSMVEQAYISFGDVTKIPFGAGLAFPFETNYSQPDPFSFTSFCRSFPRFFDHNVDGLVDTFSGISEAWSEEICKTLEGEALAHLMKALEMCKELGCRLFPVFSVGKYQGCVLEGGRWTIVRSDGKIFQPLSGVDFTKDVASLDLHSSTLKSILDKARIAAVSPADVKTMRGLQRLIHLGDGPSGELISYVSERLPQLSFHETFRGVHLNSLQEVFTLLSGQMVIPDDLPLHHDDFFSTDRVQLVLSCFGRKVPSFFTGTTMRKICKLARGPGSEKAVDHSSTPPNVVQVARIPMSRAVGEWKKLMRQGLCSGEWENHVAGLRVFTGREKLDLWASLSNFAHDCVKMDEAGGSLGEKHARGDLEEGEIPDEEQPVVKKTKQSFF